ncbi:hypothetical protein MANI_016343 [Metarhizium anisopliae]
MASIKSSLLLASLASLSLATPVPEKQSQRAQLLPYYLGKPHIWPSLQCAATGQGGRILDEKICGTWYFCHYIERADELELGHDQSYPTKEACLKDREPAPDGQETADRPREGLVPWMERGVYSSDPDDCGVFGLSKVESAMFYCSTNQYCEKIVKQGSKTLDECLALFEKRPEDPKSDTQLFQGKDDSEPKPVWA